MTSNKESMTNSNMADKEEVTDGFSWTIEMASICFPMESCIFKLRKLPDFEFSLRAVEIENGYLQVEVLKQPSTVLFSTISIHAFYENAMHPAGYELLEWGAESVESSHVPVGPTSVVTFKCMISWFEDKQTVVSLPYAPSN